MVRGWRSPPPPTLCQPASQQGGGEEVNNLAGGAWRGLEECWDFGSIFGKREFFIWRDQLSNTCVLWIGRLAEKPVFSRVEWEERYSNERESFIVLVVLFVLFSGFYRQCLTRSRRRKYSPINV